jgi:3-dehydroquinate dehydratase
MEASQITREKFRDKSVIEMFIAKRNSSLGFGGYLSALPAEWNKKNQI